MELNHKSVISGLQEIGLPGHLAPIYLEIVRLGEATAGMLIEKTGIHRELVYRSLNALVEEGLAQTYTKRHRAYYTAADPSVLTQRIESKRALAESAERYLSSIRGQRENSVEVHMGIGGLQYMLEDILNTLPDGEEYLVLGASGQFFYEVTKDFYPALAKRFTKRSIGLRMLAYQGQEFSGIAALHEGFQVRLLPFAAETLAPTVIYGNKVAHEIFDTEDPEGTVVVIVENPRVAKASREQFNGLWKLAE